MTHVRRAMVALTLLAGTAATAFGGATAAPAAPASTAASSAASANSAAAPPAQPIGNFQGDSLGNLLRLQVLGSLPIPNVPTAVDVKAVPAESKVDSTATPRSSSTGANVDANVLGATIPIQQKSQTAPPDNATGLQNTLLPINVAPLLNVQGLTTNNHARWPGDTACLASGVPLSETLTQVASASVLDLGTGASLLSLDTSGGGTVSTREAVSLIDQAGQSTRAVQSTSDIQAVPIDIGGQIKINVLSTPALKATAGGVAGSAKIDWTAPVLQITVGSNAPITLDAANSSFSVALPDNPLLNLTLSLGALSNQTTSADGTHAAAEGSLLSLTLTLASLKVAQVDLFPMTVSATAPVGGVKCPPPFNPLNEVHKDASAASVAPGGTFQYTVTVPNRGTAPISNLKVVDQITGPAGFTVVSTSPQGQVSGGTITWNDPTPLQPNETRNYTITVKVPASAAEGSTFTDRATASGTYNGTDVTQTVTLPDIPKVTTPPFDTCRLNDSNKAADHLEVQPGETFNYYIHVLNDGKTACSGVSVTDVLNSKVSFVSCTANCTHSGQNVTWNVGTVDPGSSLTLTVTVKVAASATGSIPNTALVHQPGVPDITLHTAGPAITNNSVLAPASPPGFGTAGNGGAGAKKLAFTGWNQPLWLVTLLLAAAAGGTLLLRTRRQD
ncbi:MAG TPA: hypothetical protein VHA73_00220 [Acidimicrobiales bacterium]|jgi:uncharacterized repeat protein (TIGR01451 family)|nr:hypothetical protein [Acidimicrobiales bacterium]